jgi:hypothetical protein
MSLQTRTAPSRLDSSLVIILSLAEVIPPVLAAKQRSRLTDKAIASCVAGIVRVDIAAGGIAGIIVIRIVVISGIPGVVAGASAEQRASDYASRKAGQYARSTESTAAISVAGKMSATGVETSTAIPTLCECRRRRCKGKCQTGNANRSDSDDCSPDELK